MGLWWVGLVIENLSLNVQQNQDMLVFINETIEKKCPIQAEIYTNFMVRRHSYFITQHCVN